jgi:HK97 family phage major capsid protein
MPSNRRYLVTLITERLATMRRIVDAAGGRDLTKAQPADYKSASRDVLDAAADLPTEAVQDLTKAIKSVDDLPGIVTALEGWSARHNGGRVSAGRAINDDDGPLSSSGGWATAPASYKAFDWGREYEQARIHTGKALLEVGSTAVATPVLAEPIADPRQARFVYQLMPSSEAEGGSFGYLRQTTRTNNAAEVATGALKPVSVFTLERVNDTAKVFAHVTEPIDRYLLEDAPNLRQFLDQELRYGLGRAFDAHVITDLTAAVALGAAGTFDLDGVRSAITELQEDDIEPDAIVMTPADWETIEDEASNEFASNSNQPAATDAMNRRLYGIPVMVTNSAAAGEAIVGDFRGSARIFRTGSAAVTVHDSQPRNVSGTDYADYRLNQLVFRAEMRAEVAIWRPAGVRVVSTAS